MEEQRLTQAQSAAAEVPLIPSSRKKKGKKDAGTPLPTQNGEGDSLSINSGILLVSDLRHLTFFHHKYIALCLAHQMLYMDRVYHTNGKAWHGKISCCHVVLVVAYIGTSTVVCYKCATAM